MEREQESARKLVAECCRLVGRGKLANSIAVEFSSRMRTSMGRAWTDFKKREGRIKFATKLWQRATEAERRETVVHEVAHILANLEAGKNVGHGLQWRAMMGRLGYPQAKRCHSVDTKGLKQRQSRYRLSCPKRGCDMSGTIAASTRTRHMNQLRRGARRRCRRCGSPITIQDYARARPIE